MLTPCSLLRHRTLHNSFRIMNTAHVSSIANAVLLLSIRQPSGLGSFEMNLQWFPTVLIIFLRMSAIDSASGAF